MIALSAKSVLCLPLPPQSQCCGREFGISVSRARQNPFPTLRLGGKLMFHQLRFWSICFCSRFLIVLVLLCSFRLLWPWLREVVLRAGLPRKGFARRLPRKGSQDPRQVARQAGCFHSWCDLGYAPWPSTAADDAETYREKGWRRCSTRGN